MAELNDQINENIHQVQKEINDLHTLNRLFKGSYDSRILTAEKRLKWWNSLLDKEESKQ